jgi:hypothetical protein
MPEAGANVEIAHHMHEHGHGSRRKRIWVEIGEAFLLALVAIGTAWSGYQAARWDGHEAELYGTSSRLRFEANALETRAGQEQAYDATTLNSWLQAKFSGDERLARFYARRFTPEYRTAFLAWLKTDPLTNPAAPRGPMFVPEYHNTKLAQAEELNAEATHAFEKGSQARKDGENYVRVTVLLAIVLFLIAVSQRFDVKGVREGLLGVGVVLAVVAIVEILTLPRL